MSAIVFLRAHLMESAVKCIYFVRARRRLCDVYFDGIVRSMMYAAAPPVSLIQMDGGHVIAAERPQGIYRSVGVTFGVFAGLFPRRVWVYVDIPS